MVLMQFLWVEKNFSLRSGASNFTLDDIKEAVTFACTKYGAAVHVTCNIISTLQRLISDGIEDIFCGLLIIAGVRAIIAG